MSLASCTHIDDTNGEDDRSLVKLTDEDIVKNSTSSMASLVLVSKKNGKNTVKIGKLSGVRELDEVTFKDGFEFKYSAAHYSGNLRICLVKDGEIAAELTIDSEEHSIILPAGRYSLRAAGESAKLVLTYEFDK